MVTKENLLIKTETILDEVIRIRRHLHSNPELSFKEENTSEYIREWLTRWGIEYRFPFAGTGILGIIRGQSSKGKVIALRSDMDALPIQEKSGVGFVSQHEGIMHACGHDIHMACLLGTAQILSGLKNEFSGTVLLIFQPGEEKIPGGAALMMKEGIFREMEPDLVLAQHVLPEMDSGTVGFKPGRYMASSDEIYITVKGKGGHAALRENIKDPILMASRILLSLQEEIMLNAPGDTPTVLSFGKIVADGAVNVIPDAVTLEGTFRTMNEDWRKKAHQLIHTVSSEIAKSMGGSVDLEVRHGYPVLINDPEITLKAKEYAGILLGKEKVVDMDIRMTAEDFAWFSQSYPSMMYRLGVKFPGNDEIYKLHTGSFMADENALKTGVTTMSWITLNFLWDVNYNNSK